MKLCLSCRHLSPGREPLGEALFCPHCGLSFGVRRCKSCKKKLASPLDANHCIHCGGDKLTDATAYIEFTWLPRLVSWGVVLLAAYGLWRWLSPLGSSIIAPSSGRTWLDGMLIGVFEFGGRMLIVGGTLYVLLLLASSVLGAIFPGNTGKGFNSAMTRTIKIGFRLLWQILLALFRTTGKLLFRFVEGNSIEKK